MTRSDWVLLARSLVLMALIFYIGGSILESGPGLRLRDWKEGQKRLWKRPTKAKLAIFGVVWGLVALLVLYVLVTSR